MRISKDGNVVMEGEQRPNSTRTDIRRLQTKPNGSASCSSIQTGTSSSSSEKPGPHPEAEIPPTSSMIMNLWKYGMNDWPTSTRKVLYTL